MKHTLPAFFDAESHTGPPLLCRLSAAELFVVVVMRLWAVASPERGARRYRWREGFAVARLDATATAAFDSLMRRIAAARRDGIDIRWPCSPQLGADEWRMLNILRALHWHRTQDALRHLMNMLTPAAARVAFGCAHDLAEALRESGLLLPERNTSEAVADENRQPGQPSFH